ncbi:glycosyltransferase family 4 protein [Pseudomaricurvus sp.]|uniref:glycosyltransferase family 4 protein n=1 Tax=Pseudomaricurvus sp. TaxID=2004510 RepID=UPI003F6A7986
MNSINNTLLVIGYVWPEPNSSAAGSHMQALLELFLEKGWQVTFASPAAKSEHGLCLESLGIASAEIELNNASFDEFLAELNPGVVLFDRFMMEEQFGWRVEQHCPRALRILDTEDLFCVRHARHGHFKTHQQINPELTPQLLFTELAQREIASIYRCDLSLVISEFELQLLTQRFGVDPALLIYCPFMLEPVTPTQQQQLPGFDQRQHFITIGNFRHPPNWDAVLFLQQQLWPLIRKQLPDAELHIYGSYTPPKATALHNVRQGFLVKGWADSATAVMRQARVNLAPVRFGAGLKGKLADAMASGTPSVTTSIGAEGIAGELPFAGTVNDSAEGMAAAAVTLYQQAENWQAMQAAGFVIHNQRFDKQQHWQHVYQAVENCLTNLDAHRLNNFNGAMLRHHQHKSTKYMSQWIEEKNKWKDV